MRKDLSDLLERTTDAMCAYIDACALAGFSASEIYESVKVTRKAVVEMAATALAAAPAKACAPEHAVQSLVADASPPGCDWQRWHATRPYVMQYPEGQNHMILLCKVHWHRLARGALTAQEAEAIPISAGNGGAKRLRREGDLKCLVCKHLEKLAGLDVS